MFTMSKKITPKKYQEAKDEYREASELRRHEWERLHREEKWTLQRIADYFGVDIALVSRTLNLKGK